jgi:hypothetical protein
VNPEDSYKLHSSNPEPLRQITERWQRHTSERPHEHPPRQRLRRRQDKALPFCTEILGVEKKEEFRLVW